MNIGKCLNAKIRKSHTHNYGDDCLGKPVDFCVTYSERLQISLSMWDRMQSKLGKMLDSLYICENKGIK